MTRPLEDTLPADVDLHSGKSREQLAKLITRLFDHWQLALPDQAGLLGLSRTNRASINRYRNGEPLADNQDLLDRVGCLLGIHKVLRIIFPHNRDLAYRWMTAPNRRIGKRPLDLVLEHGFEGLLAVRRYLELERGR
jgi:hypothetical protein